MAFSKTSPASKGLREALRFLSAPRRKPTADRPPPPRVLPGRKPQRIAGPLALEEEGEGDAA